jgi:hypothetical protein
MDFKEFRDRTKTFLGEVSIESYGANYEPAYMSLDYVDKNDFCNALQDNVVRKIVTGFSEYVVKSRVALQDAMCDHKALAETVKSLTDQNEYLRKQLSLLQSICDRALKPGANLEVLK